MQPAPAAAGGRWRANGSTTRPLAFTITWCCWLAQSRPAAAGLGQKARAAGTMSPALLQRLHDLLAEALGDDWQAFVRSQHSEPASRGGERFAAWLAETSRRTRQLVNEPGVGFPSSCHF